LIRASTPFIPALEGRTVADILGPEQAKLPLRLMRACILTGENQR
jgi:hypothetical protein